MVYISRILFPGTLVQFQGVTLGFYSSILMGGVEKMGNVYTFKIKTLYLSLPTFFLPVAIHPFIF